ncbi:hypothetical protein [Bacteroides acidifaciens]|uniref:hypothetical protein n=1 Tax=Bacteroides acidifaciens TaxID=85831 RepID=UPI0030143FA3
MKHLTTILAAVLCAVCLSGCDGDKTQEQIDAYMESHITEFNYKGHKFLLYKQMYAKGGVGGITHDPDCPCREKGREND